MKDAGGVVGIGTGPPTSANTSAEGGTDDGRRTERSTRSGEDSEGDFERNARRKAGELGVALAGQAEAAENVTAARTKAKAIGEAAQAEGAALVATAEVEAVKADDAYAAAWNAGKDAGWSPAPLDGLRQATGYPSAGTVDGGFVTGTDNIAAGNQHSDDVEHVADVA